MSTKTHYQDISTAARASMAHFKAILKATFFFGTYTQPENFMSLKLRRIKQFYSEDDYSPCLTTDNR